MFNTHLIVKSKAKDILKQAEKSFLSSQFIFSEIVAKEIKQSLYNSLSKKVFLVNGKKVRSNAGEPPRLDSGNLRDNLFVSLKNENDSNNQKSTIKAGIMAGALPYAYHLEYGTTKIKARPFLTPIYQKYKAFFIEQIKSIKEVFN